MPITPAQVVSAARKYAGVRFQHQGRNRKIGLDCAGLLIVTGADLAFPFEDDLTYRRVPDPTVFRAHLERQLLLDSLSRKSVGMVGLFWYADPKCPTHVGIFTDEDRVIHAYAGSRKVVETKLGDFWCERFVASFFIPGVEY